MSNEDEDIQCFLDVELETLKSIYVNELEVLCDEGNTTALTIQLYPSTADNVDQQYVRMSLILKLSAEYPDVIPDIQIKNPRGLSEEKLQRIIDDLFTKAEERKGGTMLFELIERAKDHLTEVNKPSCQCAICLYGFTDQDVFTKTKCYHYFHSHCLSRYVTHQLKEDEADKPAEHSKVQEAAKEVFCPVCRIPITFVVPENCDLPPPVSARDDNFIVTEELKELQNKMADLYEKQKNKGGIIDLEAEKKKFLLEISMVPSKTEHMAETEQPSFVQRITSEENHQDSNQRKRENEGGFPKKSAPPDAAQNGMSRDRGSTSHYQKHNRKVRGSHRMPCRDFVSRSSQSSRVQKSDKNYEENSKQNMVKEGEQQTYGNTRSVGDSVDDFEKDTMQKTVETKDISQALVDELSTVDRVGHNKIEEQSGDMVECMQNKYSNKNNSRSGYYRRFQNYNRYNPRLQKHYNDDGRRKNERTVSHDPPPGVCVSLSNERNENRQQHRKSDNYHQPRSSANYSQRSRYTEHYHQQPGQRNSYHEKGQRRDVNYLTRQNNDYQRSRHDFERKPRYHSRYQQYEPNKDELISNHGLEQGANCGNPNDQNNEKMSSAQNSHVSPEISADKCVNNIQKGINEECSQRYSKGNGNVGSKNYSSSKKTNKEQLGNHKYQNRYEVSPGNRSDSYVERSDSCTGPENGILGNSSSRGSATGDYPKPPFRRPIGNMYSEGHKSHASQHRRQDSIAKEEKMYDESARVADSSDNSDIFSPVLGGFSDKAQKESHDSSVTNTDAKNSVSRPPPGFAKKVVYGLPSVKPPPGFPQS